MTTRPLPALTMLLSRHTKRREFITLLGGAAASWPLAARAQQGERMRRIGVLMSLAADDAESPVRIAALLQGLQQLGWIDGRNIRLDYRWGAGDAERARRYAAELVALAPDVIFASGGPVVGALQGVTRTVPIVFVQVTDPVGAGFVTSLARPGANTTGFTAENGWSCSRRLRLIWCARQFLEIRPHRPGPVYWAQSKRWLLHLSSSYPIGVRDAGEIERAVSAFANKPNGGLIVLPGGLAARRRDLITGLAARYRLPAVYPYRYFVSSGGLLSYGPDSIDQYRRAAGYVDRILKGENPADLPVQAPTKYELVINRKTAKTLALTIPDKLIAIADEVIG